MSKFMISLHSVQKVSFEWQLGQLQSFLLPLNSNRDSVSQSWPELPLWTSYEFKWLLVLSHSPIWKMHLTRPTVNNSINSHEGTELVFSAVLVSQVPAKSSLCFYVKNRQKLTVGFFSHNSTLCQTMTVFCLSKRILFGFYLISFR